MHFHHRAHMSLNGTAHMGICREMIAMLHTPLSGLGLSHPFETKLNTTVVRSELARKIIPCNF